MRQEETAKENTHFNSACNHQTTTNNTMTSHKETDPKPEGFASGFYDASMDEEDEEDYVPPGLASFVQEVDAHLQETRQNFMADINGVILQSLQDEDELPVETPHSNAQPQFWNATSPLLTPAFNPVAQLTDTQVQKQALEQEETPHSIQPASSSDHETMPEPKQLMELVASMDLQTDDEKEIDLAQQRISLGTQEEMDRAQAQVMKMLESPANGDVPSDMACRGTTMEHPTDQDNDESCSSSLRTASTPSPLSMSSPTREEAPVVDVLSPFTADQQEKKNSRRSLEPPRLPTPRSLTQTTPRSSSKKVNFSQPRPTRASLATL